MLTLTRTIEKGFIVNDKGQASRHARPEVATRGTQDQYVPSGHVFASVITQPFHHTTIEEKREKREERREKRGERREKREKGTREREVRKEVRDVCWIFQIFVRMCEREYREGVLLK